MPRVPVLIPVLVLATAAFAQPRYELQLLPKPEVGRNRAVWVGENGDMTGSIIDGQTAKCYRYSNGIFTILDTPGGQCYANSGNAAGQTAGTFRYPVLPGPVTAPVMAAFANLDGRPMALFPPLAEGLRSYQTYTDAINAHGDVAGTSFFGTAAPSFGTLAWVYSKGAYRFLPDLGGPSVMLRAINEAGDVTGYAETPRPTNTVPASSSRPMDRSLKSPVLAGVWPRAPISTIKVRWSEQPL